MEDLLHEQLKLLDYAQDINATTEKHKQLFSPPESNHFFAGVPAGIRVVYNILAASPLASSGFAPRGNFKKLSISGAAIYFKITA